LSDRSFWLLFVVVVVLLPMVPAITLFKVLPAQAVVKGPFKGLKVNLGGAFAGYFVLLLLLIGVFRTPPANPTSQVWHVVGTVAFSDHAEVPSDAIRFSVVPPAEKVASDGKFDVKVVRSIADTGELDLPFLKLEAQGYSSQDISLQDEAQAAAERKIQINRPIVLNPLPGAAYKSDQKALVLPGDGK